MKTLKTILLLMLTFIIFIVTISCDTTNTDKNKQTDEEKKEEQIDVNPDKPDEPDEPDNPVDPIIPEDNTNTLYENDKTWYDSYLYSENISNGVSGRYIGTDRSGYEISNKNVTMTYNMSGDEGRNFTSITNPENGNPYLMNTMDAFIETDKGIFYATNGIQKGRANTYRQGYYYWNTHLLGQNFTSESETYNTESSINILDSGIVSYYHDMQDVLIHEDSSVSFTVNNSNDPYIAFPSSFSGDEYSVIKLVMKTESASYAQMYYGTSKNGVTGDQVASFTVDSDNEYHTYYIDMQSVEKFTGTITTIRFDVGNEGENVSIKSVSLVSHSDISVPFLLDRSFHVYSDKIHEEMRFVCNSSSDTTVKSYGTKIRIDKNTVKSFMFTDENGKSTDNPTKYYAAAFSIKNAGIIGFILPYGKLGNISVSETDSTYEIVIYDTTETTSFTSGDILTAGYRLYTDSETTFDRFINEVIIENHPAEISVSGDSFSTIGYLPYRGCYMYTTTELMGFNKAYTNHEGQIVFNSEITNDSLERNVYILSHCLKGECECSAVLDENNIMLPIRTEVCKNFSGENEEPFFDNGDTQYSEVIFPLSLKQEETRKFTTIMLYQFWGQSPLKQLSSIQFIAPYYHLSCGVTETNCIAMQYVYGKDYWLLPDFRAMSAPLWKDQPQHTSVGRLYFLKYTDENGNSIGTEYTDDEIISSGPTYADIKLNYLSGDGKIKVGLEHIEMPQTDENRTYYKISMEILDDITINDFCNNMSFFSFDSRGIFFKNYVYTSPTGNRVYSSLDVNETKKLTLSNNGPFFAYYNSDAEDYVNFALLVKNRKIIINGKQDYTNLAVMVDRNNNLNSVRLTLDTNENITLKKGDTIYIELILLPWGSQETTDYSNVEKVRNDSILNPTKLNVTTGSFIYDSYVPIIEADSTTQTAEFEITGGPDEMTILIKGLKKRGRLVVEKFVDNEWTEYKIDYHGYDGYGITYESDNTYTYSFISNLNGDSSSKYRVKIV